jgi:hypothetical protein
VRVGRRETQSIWATSEIRCRSVRELGENWWASLLGSTESATSASDLSGRSVLGPTELGGWVVGGPVIWVRERDLGWLIGGSSRNSVCWSGVGL